MYVGEQYRVNVYLDTNILVDYSEKSFPRLNESIEFLSQCDFVNLRSSHFVLFEYTEVRKANLFRAKVLGAERSPWWRKWINRLMTKSNRRDYPKAYIKQKGWKVNGVDYFSYVNEIESAVTDEVKHIREELNIDFDEHVLHEGLMDPTLELCLKTKISKEDCLVALSCVLPKKGQPLSNCVILSRDRAMHKSFDEKRTVLEAVFTRRHLAFPKLIKSESINQKYNLYQDSAMDVEACWRSVLIERIISNNSQDYIGRTYKFGTEGVAAECIYFKVDTEDKSLRSMDSLTFISKDLTWVKTIRVDFEFWNNGDPVALPHANPSFPCYSFRSKTLNRADLAALREDEVLVFYTHD